ncbi:phage major capsid protein [Clostridium botulinum D/C]|uniref:phage major capsid protein n=1 Tax=Clostridium botulinum TaxID=1491 RepID=UPI001E404EA7|nr:phage major capsid protein [Clostridium botulinum]MCD3351268.1 phage major capsid protein [Clostridium botulinum D/C]MCD3360225.1 phage major capsid protein [Clostridium botulinum D/C]MCD3361672.1 phage major capsid protein [Clostridium botulinum D/C]MCD3366030.1 phage major capsid protein [Clostridium botulinum D/C]
MSKELRELLNQLDQKNKAMGELLNKKEVTKEELENISNEIDVLQAKVEAQKKKDNLDNALSEPGGTPVVTNSNENVQYNGALFTKAVADSLLRQRGMQGLNLSEEQRNKISEKVNEDGGFAVPEDIQTKIIKRLKDTTDLFNLVDNEKVFTRKGQRTFEKRADQTPLVNLDEYGKITDVDNPKLERMSFNLHDFAGLMTIPNDLLKFADSELENFLINWLVDKVRITRNLKILYGTGSDDVQGIMKSSKYKEIELKENATLKDFKKCKNVELMNIFKPTAKWIVNQDGFNYLDSLENKTGKPYLQPDPKQQTQYLFLGLPVVELLNTILKTEEDKIPILLGDLKEAYKYFYDDNYELLTTNIGAGAFETNTTKARIITRLDGAEKDKDAIIKIKLAKSKTE